MNISKIIFYSSVFILFIFAILGSPLNLFKNIDVLAQTAPWIIERDIADADKLKFHKSDKANSIMTIDPNNGVTVYGAGAQNGKYLQAYITSVGEGMIVAPGNLYFRTGGSNAAYYGNPNITFYRNLLPSVGNTYNLGSTSQKFGNLFTTNGYFGDHIGIGTETPGADKLDVRGRAYASSGWQTTDADYAEWFEKEGDAKAGDIIGINLTTGKARKYQTGDRFIGIYSASPAVVGNRVKETDAEMSKTHILVGLLGQLDFNKSQTDISGRVVKTKDAKEIGILLSNGKVLIGR
ncbi:hypothetical protein HYU95_03055 [Candidatus Daviesbacteria bacterium]|nr:hypothetical protein [Candidatus Daviesbacteria bacterium]